MTCGCNSITFPQTSRSILNTCMVIFALLLSTASSHAQSASSGAGLAASAPTSQHNPADQGFSDYVAIAATLQKYIDAAKTGEGARQRSIWFDHAHIVGSEDGKFENYDADGFAKGISEGGPAPQVTARIVDITISGPAASARIEIQNWSGFRYTDFFLLYKRAGVWKISGKVFDSHDRN